ncbi:hypothetical protein HELRODRAFT_75443, partial [Helobdella robusta]|uniref:glycogenin glucosyltransferase n=1 Tax=Helobdella robusta TaxID=6412 RepID=T1G252_HELRO
AYVTMATNDVYAVGALVLAETLRQTNTQQDLVIMITNDVSEELQALLKASFNDVQAVSAIDSGDYEHLSLLQRSELGVTFTKIQAWRLVEYRKCVFMDADTLVLQNVDDLFSRDPFAAAPDAGWPDCFNSGIFLYQPSFEMYGDLLQFALKIGSFDGGDQGLLNLFFSDWATKDIKYHLPFTYNLAWHSYYSYKPALKKFGDEIKIVHYLGKPKPWDHEWNETTQRVICQPFQVTQNMELLQLWWDIFMSAVQPKLPRTSDLKLNRLTDLRVRSLASHTEFYLRERQRQYNWERNEIDYMGNDRFENIQKKLDEVLEGYAKKKDTNDDDDGNDNDTKENVDGADDNDGVGSGGMKDILSDVNDILAHGRLQHGGGSSWDLLLLLLF